MLVIVGRNGEIGELGGKEEWGGKEGGFGEV